MSTINQVMHAAENHCVAKGVRLTPKRKNVLTELVQSKKALSAYEVLEYYRKHYGESLPAMSIYRILEFLQQENLVHKIHLANKFIACSHITCDHSHGVTQFLICRNCTKVKEITLDNSTLKKLTETTQKAGFKLVNKQLEFDCLCDACSN